MGGQESDTWQEMTRNGNEGIQIPGRRYDGRTEGGNYTEERETETREDSSLSATLCPHAAGFLE